MLKKWALAISLTLPFFGGLAAIGLLANHGEDFWMVMWTGTFMYLMIGFLMFLLGGPWFWPWVFLWLAAMASESVSDLCDDISAWVERHSE